MKIKLIIMTQLFILFSCTPGIENNYKIVQRLIDNSDSLSIILQDSNIVTNNNMKEPFSDRFVKYYVKYFKEIKKEGYSLTNKYSGKAYLNNKFVCYDNVIVVISNSKKKVFFKFTTLESDDWRLSSFSVDEQLDAYPDIVLP